MFSQNDDHYVIDVAVKGEFPANFQFDVYDRPAPGALAKSPDGVASAMGFITAAPVGTPTYFRSGGWFSMGGTAPCYKDCENHCETLGRCEFDSTWCTEDGECYREVLVCPRLDTPKEDCRLETEGDPELKVDPFERFAGFSKNYLVMYLDEPVSADSWTAATLGATSALSSGYHLIAVRGETEDDIAIRNACWRRAENLLASRINERYGTNFTYDDLESSVCWTHVDCSDGFTCPTPEGPVCELPLDVQRAIEEDRHRDLQQIGSTCGAPWACGS